MGCRKLLNIDEQLDKEINEILYIWREKGYKNAKKPDVIRLIIKNYKDNMNGDAPKRKPKSNTWSFP